MEALIKNNLQTPIEIALQVDNEGRTTAKKLYEFLELDKSNFSRWCKQNIIENAFAEEGIDYLRFVINDETPTGGIVKRDDYKLTATFAKKLAMGCQNERGEQARQYFVQVEEGLKQIAKGNRLEAEKIAAQKARAEAMLLNAKNRTFHTIMSAMKDKDLSPIAVEVFGLKGLESAFGVEVGNYLPKMEKTYSATEAGQMLGGLSSQKIGSVAIRNNLKTDEFGVWVMDKSRHSNKEVPSFRYNIKGIEKLKELTEA